MRTDPAGETKPVPIDPDRPVYYVSVWERLGEPADLPEDERGYVSREWTA